MSRATRLLSSNPYAGRDFDNQLADDFGTITPSSPEQVDRARRYVAGVAVDVEDARLLLDMLGIA